MHATMFVDVMGMDEVSEEDILRDTPAAIVIPDRQVIGV